MRIVHERVRIDQVNWITAQNYGELKWHLFSPSLSLKGKILALDIASQKCPKNKLLNHNLLILV